MKKLLTSILMTMAIFIALVPSVSVFAEISEVNLMHFSGQNERAWDLESTGHLIVYYKCRFHGFVYATLHDVVDQGFGITPISIEGYPFPARFKGIAGDAGLFGYVFKTNPSVYIRIEPASYGPRWVILATDPSEDGINGNEIPR